MWMAWDPHHALWVEVEERFVEQSRERGYEVRCIDALKPVELDLIEQLGELNTDPTVFPAYVEQGFTEMHKYLALL